MENKQPRLNIVTDNEKHQLCQIACDIQSGHHLLYPRSLEYKAVAIKYSQTRQKYDKKEKLSDWDIEALAYVCWCSGNGFDLDKFKLRNEQL